MYVAMKILQCQKNKQKFWCESRWAFQWYWIKNKQTIIKAELKNCFRKINKNFDMNQNKFFNNIEWKNKQTTKKIKLRNCCLKIKEILILNKLN